MTICLYYVLFEPVPRVFKDTPSVEPLFSSPIIHGSRTLLLDFFANRDRIPSHARITIPDLERKEIPADLLPVIQAIKEHLITVLRLQLDQRAEVFPHTFWSFVDDLSHFEVSLGIEETYERPSCDSKDLQAFFASSFANREEIRLLVDGMDPHIPLQYRFLSLYKILELKCKIGTEWDASRLSAALDPFKSDFELRAFRGNPINHNHDLRDKCAHIKTGKRSTFGVTHLNHAATVKVDGMLPILLKVAIALVNTHANGKFQIVSAQ